MYQLYTVPAQLIGGFGISQAPSFATGMLCGLEISKHQ
jgi:hypothetical protein